MRASRRPAAAWAPLVLAAGALLALPGLALSQTAATAASAVPNAGSPPASSAEPEVQRSVVEDDLARVEELRVRGQVTRVLVRSKVLNARPYEVAVGAAGRDPSQRGRSSGQPMWHLFAF